MDQIRSQAEGTTTWTGPLSGENGVATGRNPLQNPSRRNLPSICHFRAQDKAVVAVRIAGVVRIQRNDVGISAVGNLLKKPLFHESLPGFGNYSG